MEKFLEIWRVMQEHGRDTKAAALDSSRMGEFVRARKLLQEAGINEPLDDFVRDALRETLPKGTAVTLKELHEAWLEDRRKEWEQGLIAESSYKENRHRVAGFIRFHGDKEARSFDWRQGKQAMFYESMIAFPQF